MNRKLTGGDCFRAAGMFLMEHPDHVLVHGFPTLRREPWTQYHHAWIETADGQTVREVSDGLDLTMPASLYYALGNINPAECKRYTRDDLALWVVRTGHWGPWDNYREDLP